MAVTYLRLFPAVNQFELRNGMLNVAGRLYVYYQGTDDLADIYDEDGRQLQQPAILDSDGRAPGLFVDSARVYWLQVCDRYDDQQYTVEKMVPSGGGAGSALGTEVSIVSTDGSLTIDENTSGGVKTFDIAVSEDSTQLLEWCKLSGLNTLDSDGDLAFSFASGNMAVEGGQLKLRDDSYYHITTHFDVKPDAQGIGYDTLTFTLYKVDEDNNTLLLRTFTYDVDSSVSDMVEVEYSTDVMTEGELKVYWNVTGIADGITVTIGDAQVHRVYSGIPRLPESSYATEEWVTDNFQPIGDYQPSGDYLSATESANYILTSQSGMFQPSGDYLSATESSNYLLTSQSSLFQQAGDYLSATESANYLLTSQSGMFQPSGNYQTAGDYAYNSAVSANIDHVEHDESLSGSGTTVSPLGVNTSFWQTAINQSSYHSNAGVSAIGINGRFLVSSDTAKYASYGDGGFTVMHSASGVGSNQITSHYGERFDINFNDGDYYLHEIVANKHGIEIDYNGNPGVSARYGHNGAKFTDDSGTTWETANASSIRAWNSATSAVADKLDITAQVVTSTAGEDGYITAVNGLPVSAGTDLATVSSIASSYAESAASSKLDSTASSTFYSTGNPSGFITDAALAPYQLIDDMSGYLTTGESANYYPTSNPSGFLTSETVTSLGTASFMDIGTAVISVNDLPLSANAAAIAYHAEEAGSAYADADGRALTSLASRDELSAYLTTGESANYYPTSNPSGFLTSETVTALGTTSIFGVGTVLTSVNEMPMSAAAAYQATIADNATTDADGRALTSLVSMDELSAYLTTGESANYLLTSQSSMFITSTAGCQPAGDYLSATESANYYLTSNPSGFITTAIIGIGEI